MKKMPCLFQRTFNGPSAATLHRDVTPGCEWVLAGDGTASRKWDGTACLVKDGVLFKRYDCKRGKVPPPGAIPCEDAPDPVTGHWPHWVRVNGGEPADKWHAAAFDAWTRSGAGYIPPNGTFELIGPHFNGNPESCGVEEFRRHGDTPLTPPRSFDGLREYLMNHAIEGIVFAHPDGRMCKIRRADFGLPWGSK